MDIRKPAGKALNTFYILAMVTVFVINSICYIVVFCKIRHVEKMMSSFRSTETSSLEKYHRSKKSAQNMALLVLAFLFQWSLYVAYTLWSFFGSPSNALLVADVVICNLGGVFNAIAYTLMRKYNRGSDSTPKVAKKSHESSETSLNTVSSSVTDSIPTKM